MFELVNYYNWNAEEPVQGEDFWKVSGLTPEQKLSEFFKGFQLAEDAEQLVNPTFGGYKSTLLD